jgi:hypothetical protein
MENFSEAEKGWKRGARYLIVMIVAKILYDG